MIRLQLLAKSMTRNEIAHQVINTLYLEYGIHAVGAQLWP